MYLFVCGGAVMAPGRFWRLCFLAKIKPHMYFRLHQQRRGLLRHAHAVPFHRPLVCISSHTPRLPLGMRDVSRMASTSSDGTSSGTARTRLAVRQRSSPHSADEAKYVVYEFRDDGGDAVTRRELDMGKQTGADNRQNTPDVVSHLFPRLSTLGVVARGSAAHSVLSRSLAYLLPQHFPHSVSRPDQYLSFCKWQSLQYVLGSMGGVLSTQSLLYAVGVGSGSIPLAAALNWVVKDGLGQLGGVIFASRVATNFDGDPKMWRFRGEMAMIGSTMLEICTPLVPQLFLPMASLANIGKNVSFLTASATRAAINLSFCSGKGANLGDVTAKSGSQSITASLVGTGLGIALAPLVGSSFAAVFPTFAVIASLHLYSMFRALSVVRLSSLNLQRVERVVYEFLASHRVLSPEEVGQIETFAVRYQSPFSVPLDVNPPLDKFVRSAMDLSVLMERFEGRDFITLVNDHREQGLTSVALWLMEGADTRSSIGAMLLAGMLRLQIDSGNTSLDWTSMISELDSNLDKLLAGMSACGWQMGDDHIDANAAQRISCS